MPTHTLSERRKRLPGPKKAKEMLRHDSVRGKALTKPQKGLFGVIAGNETPTRLRKSPRRRRSRRRLVKKA